MFSSKYSIPSIFLAEAATYDWIQEVTSLSETALLSCPTTEKWHSPARNTTRHPPRPPYNRSHAATFDAIRQFDTCTIANAIEHFRVRLRNEGFTRPGLQCVTGGSPRILGYAATCRVRSADPPMSGNAYVDRTDWWETIGLLPVPRIAVFQDLDAADSGASTIGEVHAAILKAFHCEGVITNGSVRDIPGVSRMEFPMFASAVSVSHSYMHIVDFGAPVEIFGLPVRSGDLLYADVHGVVSIPLDIAARIPEVASGIRAKEREIIDLCQSPEFSHGKATESRSDQAMRTIHAKRCFQALCPAVRHGSGVPEFLLLEARACAGQQCHGRPTSLPWQSPRRPRRTSRTAWC